VCAELKFLYVAVTRARKNLWIVDSSERGSPMRAYWLAHGLVQHHTPGSDAELPRLAEASSPEEWGKIARTLFDSKRYFQAMHAYERAAMTRERAVAHAYHLREQARAAQGRADKAGRDERRAAFRAAADAFVGCAKDARKERKEYFRIAADLFYGIEDYGHAGDAYTEAHRFTDAARTYRKAGLFDKTVGVLKAYREKIDEDVANALVNVSRLYYFKQNDLRWALAAALFR
jgi:tetratricopeptide (TPR) repeat protein